MPEKIRLGISTCLLGESVRYDGGHKLDRYLRDILGQYVEYVPVCPEVECGLPIPRESIRLEGDPDNPRLVTVMTHRDLTAQMKQWGENRLNELECKNLCGCIFMTKSPSSGMRGIKVFTERGKTVRRGVGIWARMFMERFPLLPVEDEERLHNPVIRENFIERVFVFKRWRDMIAAEGKKPGALVRFHTAHKLLVMSHSVEIYRELGRLVAGGKTYPPAELFERYIELLAKALKLRATIKKHVNVLHHMTGYFKTHLDRDEKQELLEIIDDYAREFIPLIVPVTLINHYVRKYDQPYLKGQVYLRPHPVELKLRNHA